MCGFFQASVYSRDPQIPTIGHYCTLTAKKDRKYFFLLPVTVIQKKSHENNTILDDVTQVRCNKVM